MATVFRSSGITAEMEADTVKEVLESNGVPAIVTGLDVLPGAHEVVVQVSAERQEEAERLIAEALAGRARRRGRGRESFRRAATRLNFRRVLP